MAYPATINHEDTKDTKLCFWKDNFVIFVPSWFAVLSNWLKNVSS